MQNVTIDWKSLSIIDIIRLLLPCKKLKYIKKWMNCTNLPPQSVCLRGGNNGEHYLYFEQHDAFGYSCYAYGSSVDDACTQALKHIADQENMRNQDELCIWLDIKADS